VKNREICTLVVIRAAMATGVQIWRRKTVALGRRVDHRAGRRLGDLRAGRGVHRVVGGRGGRVAAGGLGSLAQRAEPVLHHGHHLQPVGVRPLVLEHRLQPGGIQGADA
jgi:hypothetical protein